MCIWLVLFWCNFLIVYIKLITKAIRIILKRFNVKSMKVKILSRNPDDYLRETKFDLYKKPRNYDPSLHPFQQCREYVRALNATKLERVFAKPFLGSLDGHHDGVYIMAKHPKRLSTILSGSYDGEIRMWDLSNKRSIASIQAHEGYVRGMCVEPTEGQWFLSVGDDKSIKQWSFTPTGVFDEPVLTIPTKPMFATCGEGVEVWDYNRTTPVQVLNWGVDTLYKLKFNPVETNILVAAASDRSLILYDSRGNVPLRKVILKLKSNAIAWNPMEAFMFTAANEDYNLYTFDMRNLSNPVVMHSDHVAAVMDVDFSPTGREFVSGGYDKVLRIFPSNHTRSREVYHTKRMQRIVSVLYSSDAKFVLSGSDEMNIRLWKAVAWQKLGPIKEREKESLEYAEKLKEKYAAHPEIRRIAKHRQVPKHVLNAKRELTIIKESKKKKEENIRANSKPGSFKVVAEKKKNVVGEQE